MPAFSMPRFLSDHSGWFIALGVFAVFAVLITIIFMWALWLTRQRARKLGIVPYRRIKFVYPVFSAGGVAATAASLDDRALLGAFTLPDHRASAKEIIAAELGKRRIESDGARQWVPTANELTIPPAIKTPISLERYNKVVQVRRTLSRWFRVAAIICLPLVPASCLSGGDDEKKSSIQFERPAAGSVAMRPSAPVATMPSNPLSLAAKAQTGTKPADDASTGWPWLVLGGLGAVLLAWFAVAIVALPVGAIVGLVAVVRGRERAVRVLLLRPFGAAKMTTPLKRVVLQHLGAMGLVYTLEDRNYKPGLIFTIAGYLNGAVKYVLGPLVRPVLRIVKIKNEYGYLRLAIEMSKVWGPSWKSLVNGGQAFAVRSVDPWWQRAIDLMMYSTDIIVMDVSIVRKGSTWEIDRLEAHGLLDKCLFIAHQEHAKEGAEAVAKLLPRSFRPDILLYNDKGEFAEAAKLTAALQTLVGQALTRWGTPQPTAVVAASGA